MKQGCVILADKEFIKNQYLCELSNATRRPSFHRWSRRVGQNKKICDAFIRVCNSCGHASPHEAGYAHAQETPGHR